MEANGERDDDRLGSEEPSADQESELARKDREWAAGADAPRQDPGSAPAPATGPGGGGTASTASQPYRTPKHLRTSSGPRLPARGLLAVFGLLGVLLTIAIMAVLAVRVFDGVSGEPGSGDDTATQDDTGLDDGDPGAGDGESSSDVRGAGGTDGAELDPSGSTDAAGAADCETQRATIETAALAFEITTGAAASSVDELVAAGYLRPPEKPFSQELTADGSVVGTGDCAP